MALRFLILAAFVFTPLAAGAQDSDPEELVSFRPGEGVQLRSSDDQFGVGLSGLLQIWGTAAETVDTGGAGLPTGGLGAQIRRGWITLNGHFFGRNNRLVLRFGQSSVAPTFLGGDSGFGIVDAFLGFHQLRDMEVRVGLQLLPFLREWVTTAPNLSLPERSLAALSWHTLRRFGVTIGSDDLFGLGRIRYRAGVFLAPIRDTDQFASVGVMARVDVSLVGSPMLTEGGDLTRSPSPRLALGGAYAYLQDEFTPDGFGTVINRQHATADLLFRIHGLSAEGSLLWRKSQDIDEADFGAAAVLGYVLPWIDLEATIRYSAISTPLVDNRVLAQEWTGGLSYYFTGEHAFKLQLSVQHDQVGDADGIFSGILGLQANL